MAIRNLKDFLSGAMFVAFGCLGLWFGRDYVVGTSFKMGPGYFPLALSLGLLAIGLIVMGRSLVLVGEAPERGAWRPVVVVLGAVAAFGLLIEMAGLVTTVAITVAIAGLASRERRTFELGMLAIGMSIFCSALFIYALGLPMPLWPR